MLKTAQMTTLKTYIDSVPVLAALPNDSETALYIAGQLDIAAAPDFWVYRTVVTKQEVTSKPSVDGTTFSFPALISRTPQEQFGWSELWAARPRSARTFRRARAARRRWPRSCSPLAPDRARHPRLSASTKTATSSRAVCTTL